MQTHLNTHFSNDNICKCKFTSVRPVSAREFPNALKSEAYVHSRALHFVPFNFVYIYENKEFPKLQNKKQVEQKKRNNDLSGLL